MQTIVALSIVATALAYAAWRAHRLFSSRNRTCDSYGEGCEGCIFQQKQQKQACNMKKQTKKFGKTKKMH
jgi:hypothetical protein